MKKSTLPKTLIAAFYLSIGLSCLTSHYAIAQSPDENEEPKFPDIQDYIDNPDLEIPPPKDQAEPSEAKPARQGRAPAFWGGGKFPEFKTKEAPPEKIVPTSSGYKDTWIGRSAGRPEIPPEEVEKAKTEVETIFEGEYMAPPKEKIATRYSAQVKLVRDGKTIGPFEVREYIRAWIRADQKREPKQIMYSLPSYRMEGDNVRVRSSRVESSPRKIITVSVLFGKTVGTEWKILEDIWSEPGEPKKK
jgi:hypothetical protein